MEIHIVRAGETLYGIAGQYRIDPATLQELNGIPPDGALATGQALVIRRVGTFHTVQPGETLTAVARLYGIPLRRLYRNNFDLGGEPDLQTGQRLVIAYQDQPAASTHTNGYAYPFITSRLLSAELPYMSYLTPFTYGLNGEGGLVPLADEAMLSQARRLGTAALMHLSTITESEEFSSERAVMVLTDMTLQSKLIDQILETISAKGYQGLDVDFEFIPGERREAYAMFIHRLEERLSVLGLPVTVALAPKTSAGQPGLLYEAHDYALLGEAADFVLLMTYEWGLLAHTFVAIPFAQIQPS